MDILVIESPNGELKSSAFHVRFGSLKVMKSHETEIEIYINSTLTPLKMKLASNGDAYFMHNEYGTSLTQNINDNNENNNNEIFPNSKTFISQNNKNHLPNIKKNNKFFPTSNELKQLNLKKGENEICFMVKTAQNGIQTLKSFIYLWQSNVKIIISDIDGTITRSDILGQVLPFFGGKWSHDGVIELYNNIYKNGYKFLYLTARAIGQSNMTKNYLENLMQGKENLPKGPLFMSPNGIFTSLKREVIEKKPHILKISVLNEIKSLFPDDCNPFYAGFGNRETDGVAYRFMGIQLNNIYIVNSKSNVIQLGESKTTNYKSLNNIIETNFPKICDEDNENDKINDIKLYTLKD